ncbi:MAG: PDZ domain-containing protein [Candidatus Omnitrophota bacterium]
MITMAMMVSFSYADTITLKDNTSIKGLVVEEYKDRVVFSTVDGEKKILRNDIKDIQYDAKEHSYLQLGRLYDERGMYENAAFYYREAMKINPEYKDARMAYIATHDKLLREKDKLVRKEIARRDMVVNWHKREKITPSTEKDKISLLWDILGFRLVEKKGIFIIDEIKPYSSSSRARLKANDVLVAVWGKMVSFAELDYIVEELKGPKYSEVKIDIEREVTVPIRSKEPNIYQNLGIDLGFEYDGLQIKDIEEGGISESSGLKKGDLIIAIGGYNTRYLPLDDAIDLIDKKSIENNTIDFTVRRNITLRREGDL